MRARRFHPAARICTICGGYFYPGGSIDARCEPCREKARIAAAANITCSRCGGAKPAGAHPLCETCSTARLVADCARYGSD